jgi:hypothetical protein
MRQFSKAALGWELPLDAFHTNSSFGPFEAKKGAGLNPHLRFFQRGQQFLCLTNLLLLFLCFGFKSCHLRFVGFHKFGDFGRAKRVS